MISRSVDPPSKMILMRSSGIIILRFLLLGLILSETSKAALLSNIRKLVVAPGPADSSVKVSPSPSPNPSIVVKSNNGTSAVPESSGEDKGIGSLTDERCEATPYSCHQNNLTACVQFAEKVPVEASLLVQNGGDGTLRVNASISPNNMTFTNIVLLKSQARKIDVTAILRGNQEIILTSQNESCVIYIGLSVPSAPVAGGSFFQKLPYADQVTPVHGVILFSATLLIIGGLWACCKSETSERQGDGVPYQELEMGQSNSTLAVNMEEGNGGWDEDWDDNWDDDQGGIKSPPVKDHHESNTSVNDLQPKPSSKAGWDDDWED